MEQTASSSSHLAQNPSSPIMSSSSMSSNSRDEIIDSRMITMTGRREIKNKKEEDQESETDDQEESMDSNSTIDGEDGIPFPASIRVAKKVDMDHRPESPNNQPIMDEESPSSELDAQELEKYKKAVYDHPLFPILALLVERCEYSTATLGTCAGAPSFNSQVEAFVQSLEKEGKPLVCDDPEVDTLMIKAIQVLRIHLLEMEKVQDLCKDFCTRYISCLRTKMSSENLLRGVSSFGPNGSFEGSSRSSSPSTDEDCHQRRPPPPPFVSQTTPQNVFSMAENCQVADQVIGSDGSGHCRLVADAPKVDSGNEGDLSDDASLSTNGTKSKSSQKRGILPKQATSIMRSWLFQHIVHPYPTEDEKKTIAAQTNLTLLQVNNWFINARRRILQPMLDSANCSVNAENHNGNSSKSGSVSKSAGVSSKKLKVTTNNSPSTSKGRSWPESISGSSRGARDSID